MSREKLNFKPKLDYKPLTSAESRAESIQSGQDKVLFNAHGVENHSEYLFGVDGVISGTSIEAKPFSALEVGSQAEGSLPSLKCLCANVLAPFLYDNLIEGLQYIPWNPVGKYLWTILVDRFHRPPGCRLSGQTVSLFYAAYPKELEDQLCYLEVDKADTLRFEHVLRLESCFGDSITHLDLHGTTLLDSWMPVLSRLERLAYLDVSKTGLSDAGVHEFCMSGIYRVGLSALRTLLLGDASKVTEKVLRWFADLPSLQVAELPFKASKHGSYLYGAVAMPNWNRQLLASGLDDELSELKLRRDTLNFAKRGSKFVKRTVFPKALRADSERDGIEHGYFYRWERRADERKAPTRLLVPKRSASRLRAEANVLFQVYLDERTPPNAIERESSRSFYEEEEVQTPKSLGPNLKTSTNPFKKLDSLLGTRKVGGEVACVDSLGGREPVRKDRAFKRQITLSAFFQEKGAGIQVENLENLENILQGIR